MELHAPSCWWRQATPAARRPGARWSASAHCRTGPGRLRQDTWAGADAVVGPPRAGAARSRTSPTWLKASATQPIPGLLDHSASRGARRHGGGARAKVPGTHESRCVAHRLAGPRGRPGSGNCVAARERPARPRGFLHHGWAASTSRRRFGAEGIASALCRAVEAAAAALGHERLYLFTLDRQALYQHLGWHPLERTTWRGRDADVMWKALLPTPPPPIARDRSGRRWAQPPTLEQEAALAGGGALLLDLALQRRRELGERPRVIGGLDDAPWTTATTASRAGR